MRTRFPILSRLSSILAAGVLAVASLASQASEDVDIFGGKPSTGAPPNVLIVLDSSSNWNATLGIHDCPKVGNMNDNTKFAAEVCALKTVIPLLSTNMRLGIMMFAETGRNGAYVRFAIRSMTSGNKTALLSMLDGWIANGSDTDNSGSNQPYAKAMFEAFKYFGGGGTAALPQGQTGFGPEAFAGGQANNSGTKRRDHKGNTSNRAAPSYTNPDGWADWAFENAGSNTYLPPTAEACTKNFIIFISNGNPSTGGDAENPSADTLFANIGGNPAASARIRLAGTEVHASLMDEFARHFYNNDLYPILDGQQRLQTYTISVWQPQRFVDGKPIPSNTDAQMIKLMESAAAQGGGLHFNATDPSGIKNALLKILNDVQAVNSVFVSASLPVSVNTQGTFLNQVYMGLFRPEPNPRWLGNVKEYKFIQDSSSGEIYLADQTGNRAVNVATGFVAPGATSFWTTDSNFWARDEKGLPPSKSDAPDGDVVEKGGAAQMQRKAFETTQAGRRLYTCPGYVCDSPNMALTYEFNAVNITDASKFGVSSAAEVSLLVNWIRGADNAKGATSTPTTDTEPCNNTVSPCAWDSNEKGPGWPVTVRPSIQGDVLHSRPVVLNYSTALGHAVNGPYLFYGSNDGLLRAVKGGQGVGDGVEVWSFIAPEFLSKFKRLRLNDPPWLNPGTPEELKDVAKTKDYFFDGPIGAWEDNTTSPPTKWIFVTARRGGRVIYAFDVTNPENPVLKWAKNNTHLSNLGQTWSMPIAFKLSGATDPYLVFGAGYDPGEDSVPPVNNGYGRGIYVLNANDGTQLAFLTHAEMTSPIASDMAFLAKPAVSGFGDVYRGYVGDLNGNVWRLDITGTTATDWKLYKFAKLGDGLKFLYAPDLVKAGDRDMVLLGTGDREKPLVTDSTDYFFGIADVFNGEAPQSSDPGPIGIDALTLISGSAVIPDAPAKGWYRVMAPGEKVVNSPLTVAGVTFFATNKPVPTPPGSCQTNLGEARAYGVAFLTGGRAASREAVSTVLTGGGLPPSPVGGVVELEPGKLVTFVIGSGKGGSRLEPERPPLNVPTTRTKIYWNSKSDVK